MIITSYLKFVQIVPVDFWSDGLFNVVLSCVLEPGVIGFNMGDVEVIEKLPEQVWSDYVLQKKHLFIVNRFSFYFRK